MSYSRPTLTQIYNRIRADLETKINNRSTANSLGILQVKILRYSLLGVLIAVFAGMAHMLYGYIAYLMKQILPDVAEDEWLERWALLFGYPRKAATYATGVVQFSGTDDSVIPSGTVIQDDDLVQFETTAEATIVSGYASSVPIQAVVANAAGNTAYTTLTLVSPITGVDSTTTITTALSGGTDLEAIEELRARLLLKLRTPVTGGRATDYITWALSVTGVSAAWCFPTYLGPGTVGVVCSGEDGSAISSSVLTSVTTYINAQKPIGVTLGVFSVEPTVFACTIAIPSATTDTIRQALKDNMQSLFNDEAAPTGTILLSHINSALITSGVSDYSISAITQDGVTYAIGNIVTTGFALATLGTITLVDL